MPDIVGLKGISVAVAEDIRKAIRGEIVPHHFAGRQHVTVWNNITRRKVWGCIAPTVHNVEEWLRARPDYERYVDQDMMEKGPNQLPESSKMELDVYVAYCQQSSGDVAQLRSNLHEYALHLVESATADRDISAVILRAGERIGHSREDLRASLQLELDGGSSTPSSTARTPLSVLQTASGLLRRPIWVFTSLASNCCVCEISVDGVESDPRRVSPLRLAQHHGSFFTIATGAEDAVVEAYAEDMPTGGGPPADDPTAVHAGEVHLPAIKEDVATALHAVLGLTADAETWSKKHFGTSLNLDTFKQPIIDYQERLCSGEGRDAVLIGDNGVGKSTLINLCAFNTMQDESTYKTSSNCMPEAVKYLYNSRNENETSREAPPTLKELLHKREVRGRADVSIQLLSDESSDDAAAVQRGYQKLESSISKYGEKDGRSRPKVADFLLPCGMADQSTTTLHTRVRYGSTVHALVEFSSVEELQQQAYEFVQLRRDLGDDDPDDLDEKKKRDLKYSWHTYITVTNGTVRVEDLPISFDGLPNFDDALTWNQITVCDALREIVKSSYVLYLGGGTDLHLDRKHAHDLLWRLNNKDELHRVAAKSVDVFVPAAVFQGGCSFVDLPGLNDVDPKCFAQTVDGLKDVGAVYVVLRKSLFEDKATLGLLEEAGLLRRIVQHGDVDVVFITNREVVDQSLAISAIMSAEEETVREKLKKRTSDLWRKELAKVNKQLQKAGEPHRTDDEIGAIAQRTQICAVYPMAHTALQLNAGKRKEEAAALFQVSGMYWLLGSLEALNRDGYVRELERIVQDTLPGLRAKLESSATQGSGELPEQLVNFANKTLKQRSMSSSLGHLFESLKERVAKPLTTDSNSYKAQLNQIVLNFIEEDPSVNEFLAKAAKDQSASLQILERRMDEDGYGVSLRAISPGYKGALKRLPIMPVVFGSINNPMPIKFKPLIENLEAMLEQIKQVVIERVVSTVDDVIKDAGGDGDMMSVRILKESFARSDLLATMNQRFANFFSADRHAALLKNRQPAEYFNKVAGQRRLPALQTKMLSKHALPRSLDQVKQLVSGNLEATRMEWKRLVASELENFVGQQFSTLYDDLTWGERGLLKSLLRSFLQHIVQTSAMYRDAKLKQQLFRYLRELTQSTNTVHALWTRLIKRDNPEELGRAAAQHVERTRLRLMIERLARNFALGKPNRRMAPLRLLPRHQALWFSSEMIFMEGDLDKLLTLNKEVLTNYKRGVWTTGHSDLFRAFGMAVWGRSHIKECLKGISEDPLTEAAGQLRAVCIEQIRHHYADPGDRRNRIEEALGEQIEPYLERLERDTYRGDALCLFFLANHFEMSIVLWRPGEPLPKPVIFSGSARRQQPATAHHLVLATEEPAQRGGGESEAFAAFYRPTWYFQDERGVNFKSNDTVEILPETDDDTAARKSVSKTTTLGKESVVRTRELRNGVIETLIDGVPISREKRQRSGPGPSSSSSNAPMP